jgi:predicted TIM-barrel fold metal-dependent hydrolase
MPPGAVDTHAHVIGLPPDYPFVSERSYTPQAAPAGRYIGMLDGTGFTYGVLVQVSVHGSDNRLMLETLRAYPGRLRGVAVAPADLPSRAYVEMKDAGIVALRLNELFGGGIGFDQLERFDDLASDMGWHLQLLLSAETLTSLRGRLSRLKSHLVVDHMANVSVTKGVDDPGFQNLVDFVRDGGWVKLSGGFRNTAEGPPYRDTVPFARALIDAAPTRCVWGSDWPHVAHWGPMMPVADLLDLLADWAPDERLRTEILVGNPAELYGFA